MTGNRSRPRLQVLFARVSGTIGQATGNLTCDGLCASIRMDELRPAEWTGFGIAPPRSTRIPWLPVTAPGSHAIHSAIQVVFASTFGLGRSGGTCFAAPMWTNPATNSWSSRPSAEVRNSRSSASQDVSQFAPQPLASAAFSKARHTAPAERVCSTCGIFSDGSGDEMTATMSGEFANADRAFSTAAESSPRSAALASAIFATLSRAGRSSTTKRQGSSIPWSGDRAAAVRIVCNSARPGGGPERVLAGRERLVSRKSSASVFLSSGHTPSL